jgi:hypothetical protein
MNGRAGRRPATGEKPWIRGRVQPEMLPHCTQGVRHAWTSMHRENGAHASAKESKIHPMKPAGT